MSSPHEWIDAYFDGALAPEEELPLVNWLRADPEHARTFVRAAHDHQTLHDTLLAEAICRSCVTGSTALPLPRNDLAGPATGAVQPAVKRVSVRTPRVRALPPPRPARRKSTAAWLALAAGFVAILGLAVLLARPRPETVVARVLNAGPGAVVIRGKRPIPCAAGMSLSTGSLIRTDGPASVIIGFPDTTRLDVRPGAELTLQPASRTRSPSAPPEGKRVFIVRGSLTARVAKQPPDRPMVFVTPTVEVKVLGTELAIDAAKDTTRVEVKEGRVQVVRTADQATLEVAGGQFVLAGNRTELKAEPVPAEPAGTVRNGSLNELGSPPTADDIEKLRQQGWECPEARKWPQWWGGLGSNAQVEWFTKGGVHDDAFGRITGENGFLVVYHGLKLADCDYILTVWAKGDGDLRMGFLCYGRNEVGDVVQLFAPSVVPPPLKVVVRSEEWIRYQHVMRRTPQMDSVHVTITASEGTIDFDAVDLVPATPARCWMVKEAEELYETDALITNRRMVPKGDAAFTRKQQEYQTAIAAFQAQAANLGPQVSQSIKEEMTAVETAIREAGGEVPASTVNDMILLARVCSKRASSSKAVP